MEFAFCRRGADTAELARFFCRNLTAEYISHAELMGPRALDPATWSPDIEAQIRDDFAGRLDAPLDPAPGTQTMLAAELRIEGELAGAFLLTFSRVSPVPHCVLEDIVVDASRRSQGLGARYLAWAEGECRRRGIPRIFLESGLHNHDAHHFFERHGFAQTSVVMMKTLP